MRSTIHTLSLLAILLIGMGADSSTVADGPSVLAIVREFGFPVLVAVWFMWRVEKRMDRFTDVVQNLLTTVTVMAKTIDDLPAVPAKRQRTSPPEAA
jgi:hypothetical protein